MHIGEPELATLELEGESLMVDAEQVHDRGLEVMHMNLILHRTETEIVRFALRKKIVSL